MLPTRLDPADLAAKVQELHAENVHLRFLARCDHARRQDAERMASVALYKLDQKRQIDGDSALGGGVVSVLDEALAVVKAAGYVVLKDKSYRQAQERQRVADALRQAHDEDAALTTARSWARDCLDQERMLRERVTYLAALCMKLGATMDQLRGEDEDAQQASYLDFLKPIARYDHSIGRWVPLEQSGEVDG